MIRISGTFLLLALAGCAGGTYNPTVSTQKVATITTSQLAYDVRFGPDNALTEAQAKALADYLAAIRVGYADQISVDDPRSHGRAERRAAIVAVAAKFGLLVEETGPLTPAMLKPGVTRIVINRSHAEVRNCPDWSRPSHPETEFSTMSNYGCAVQGNLAAMTADPTDLLAGKPYSGSDGNTTAKAITNFRAAPPAQASAAPVSAMSPGDK